MRNNEEYTYFLNWYFISVHTGSLNMYASLFNVS